VGFNLTHYFFIIHLQGLAIRSGYPFLLRKQFICPAVFFQERTDLKVRELIANPCRFIAVDLSLIHVVPDQISFDKLLLYKRTCQNLFGRAVDIILDLSLIHVEMKNHSFKKLFLLFTILLFFQTPEVKCATYEADYVPWSGYWWPTDMGGLATGWGYRGHPAPFEKYDYVTTGIYDGPATRFGREYFYDEDAVSWAGLCFAWSAAAVLEEEPVHNGLYKGMLFRIGDKKGLLTALYVGTLLNTYSTDKPEEFHKVLEEFIAHQKTPVIMDLGTDGEHWNYPVFKYETDHTQDGNTRHYTTTIHYVTDQVHPDFVGAQFVTQTFYYYFILDEDGNITESEWENESTPPVNAYEPLSTESINPYLDYDQIIEIVTTNDDPHEENNSFESAAPLSSGTYTLIAADNDYFKVELKKR